MRSQAPERAKRQVSPTYPKRGARYRGVVSKRLCSPRSTRSVNGTRTTVMFAGSAEPLICPSWSGLGPDPPRVRRRQQRTEVEATSLLRTEEQTPVEGLQVELQNLTRCTAKSTRDGLPGAEATLAVFQPTLLLTRSERGGHVRAGDNRRLFCSANQLTGPREAPPRLP